MGTMSTGSAGLTPQFQTYYNKKLLAHAMPLIVTAQFAQKRPFPKNKGAKTMRFFRPNVADRTRVSSLTEGTPIGSYGEVTLTPIDVTMAQYGEAVKITDILSYTDLVNTLDNSIRMMGEDAAVHADFKCVTEIVTNTGNKRYTGGATNFAGLVAKTADQAKLTIKDFLGSFTKLTLKKARKPEGREYPCIITPEQAYDVMLDTDFIEAGTHGTNEGLFNGEVGKWFGHRILQTTEGWIESDTEGTYDSAGGIYSAMVLGREALGAPIMAGQSPFSPHIIINNKPDSGNPLNQFMTAGWKAYWATVTLNSDWSVVIRSKSTFAA